MHDAIVGNKQAAADRCGISWRAVNNACVRVATEALGRVDLLECLVAVAIDEVKDKKGQRYLTVVCDRLAALELNLARDQLRCCCSLQAVRKSSLCSRFPR